MYHRPGWWCGRRWSCWSRGWRAAAFAVGSFIQSPERCCVLWAVHAVLAHEVRRFAVSNCMVLRLIFFTLFLSASCVVASGVTLTQDGAVAYALKHNPALASARMGLEEARGRLQQSGRLSNPELEFEWNRNTRSSESAARWTLLQRFPLTGRLRHEKAVSRAQFAAAEFEVRDAERKLAVDVRVLAVKLLALQAQSELRSNQTANLREVSAFLRKAAQTGEGALTDALQVELEARQIDIDKLQIAADEAVLLGEFRLLLGSLPSESVAVVGKLAAPSEAPPAGELKQRPDVQAAQSRVDAARFSVREQHARRIDDIGAGLTFSQERTLDAPNPMQTDRTIGFRVTLPLPLWNNNAGRIHEASAALTRAEREASAVRLSASNEREAARQAMEAYSKILSTLDASALPQATQLEEQLRSSHASGQTPLLDVLRTRSRRLELQRQRLDVLRDYHLARIRFNAATPQPKSSK